ncbi:nitronate monooxygenase [Trichoderma arundinaceum]|uniref:Nitronate monooxygenase n=1 Tax=Trichoderma arundinaceum TaxID=490622 RepID=A0A395NZG8_TRIAR|nr:nitronate monooxygenase [Trichoderma arundinaceum]
MSCTTRIKRDLPWIQLPFIANAPMSGIATSKLAVAVTLSGGLGQIGFTGSTHGLEVELESAQGQLKDFMAGNRDLDVLPVGVGVIVTGSSLQRWLPIFERYKPAVIWLSFGSTLQMHAWARGIREATSSTKVWIQVGSVNAALQAAQSCQPDALVMQGSDAGGHGHARGASVVTLVPEAADTLRDHGLSHIPILAAGGIMDGRGVAAAITLGAEGAVLGTRFIGAEEATVDSDVREEVFTATDGGESTVRSRVFDDIWDTNPWPPLYDGRCLRGAIYNNLETGMSINEVREQLYRDSQRSQVEEVKMRDIACIWAGTGVGMVTKLEQAADIVKQVQEDARKRLHDAKSFV